MTKTTIIKSIKYPIIFSVFILLSWLFVQNQIHHNQHVIQTKQNQIMILKHQINMQQQKLTRSQTTQNQDQHAIQNNTKLTNYQKLKLKNTIIQIEPILQNQNKTLQALKQQKKHKLNHLKWLQKITKYPILISIMAILVSWICTLGLDMLLNFCAVFFDWYPNSEDDFGLIIIEFPVCIMLMIIGTVICIMLMIIGAIICNFLPS